MTRDPRLDPHEGDELSQAGGALRLFIDRVTPCEVAYRVVDASGGLNGAYRTRLSNWRMSAPYTCDQPGTESGPGEE